MHTNRKLVTVLTLIIGFLAISIISIYLRNYSSSQANLNKTKNAHTRNNDTNTNTHYGKSVFYLKDFSNNNSFGHISKISLQSGNKINWDNNKEIHFIYIKNTNAVTSQEQHELQSAMEKVLSNDRNKDIEVLVSIRELQNSRELVYDLVNISGEVSAADLFRVLLQFSEQIKEKNFDSVRLCYQRKEKFLLKGQYFQKLGKEYSFQNPVYTVRTFTENVYNIDGSRAYPTWTGGMVGVVGKQMEDFNDFNKKWYLDDWIDAQNYGENQK